MLMESQDQDAAAVPTEQQREEAVEDVAESIFNKLDVNGDGEIPNPPCSYPQGTVHMDEQSLLSLVSREKRHCENHLHCDIVTSAS